MPLLSIFNCRLTGGNISPSIFSKLEHSRAIKRIEAVRPEQLERVIRDCKTMLVQLDPENKTEKEKYDFILKALIERRTKTLEIYKNANSCSTLSGSSEKVITNLIEDLHSLGL